MWERLVNSESNARRIAEIDKCFGASGQPLAIPGRVLFADGVLMKMCRKKIKPRRFLLFNDILVYANIVVDRKKYNKQHIIPLEEVKVENLEDDGDLKNGWLIKTPTKSFAVYSPLATGKTEWMKRINISVEYLLFVNNKKPTLEHAAVWIPDASASICMQCRKTKFTVLNRKHHCRKCGAVVCNLCSSKKFLLPAQSSKPLRVCLSCYDALSNQSCTNVEETPTEVSEKSVNQDSSGEDDSEDDSEDEEDESIEGEGATKELTSLSLDNKPAFYEDEIYNQIAKELDLLSPSGSSKTTESQETVSSYETCRESLSE